MSKLTSLGGLFPEDQATLNRLDFPKLSEMTKNFPSATKLDLTKNYSDFSKLASFTELAKSYAEASKNFSGPTPLVHSLPQSVPSHQAVSLQHKLQAKKMNAPKIKSEPKKMEPVMTVPGKIPRPAHEASIYTAHPVIQPPSDFSLHKPSLPMKTTYTPHPAHPSSTKFSSSVIKKLPESLQILPTGTAREPGHSLTQQQVFDSRHNILTNVPNLDQTVAEAIKGFGSSITITAAKSQKASYSEASASSGASSKNPQQTKEEPKNAPTISEVIVLDD